MWTTQEVGAPPTVIIIIMAPNIQPTPNPLIINNTTVDQAMDILLLLIGKVACIVLKIAKVMVETIMIMSDNKVAI